MGVLHKRLDEVRLEWCAGSIRLVRLKDWTADVGILGLGWGCWFGAQLCQARITDVVSRWVGSEV